MELNCDESYRFHSCDFSGVEQEVTEEIEISFSVSVISVCSCLIRLFVISFFSLVNSRAASWKTACAVHNRIKPFASGNIV